MQLTSGPHYDSSPDWSRDGKRIAFTRDTGKVIEFRNEEIERLQERVARELGFTLVGHRLELFGVPLKRGRK